MKDGMMKKGLVCNLIIMLIGLSIGVLAEGRRSDFVPASTPVNANQQNIVTSPRTLLPADQWLQVQQLIANTTQGYLIYSSSGTGGSVHLFAKIPHLLNSKGVCVAGIIMYTGLVALTMVWRITNGTTTEVVKLRPGPQVVMFTGIGYSFFKHNIKGGSGRIVAVSLRMPSIVP